MLDDVINLAPPSVDNRILNSGVSKVTLLNTDMMDPVQVPNSSGTSSQVDELLQQTINGFGEGVIHRPSPMPTTFD
jgi:hypothetical protein